MIAIRKLPVAALLAALVALSWPAIATDGSPPAPEFTLANRTGGQLSLSGLRGQVVMINFWASWCGPCRRELPELDRLHRELSGRGGQVIAVSIEPEKPK